MKLDVVIYGANDLLARYTACLDLRSRVPGSFTTGSFVCYAD